MTHEFPHPIQSLILLDEDSPMRRITKDGTLTLQNDLERYILQCAKGLSVLTSALEKATLSIELLKFSKSPLPGATFTHAEQIEYAIENYFIRSSTIYDRALIFTSHLLDLGVSDASINHELVVTNDHVKRFQLDSHLKKLGKASREKSTERNAIIHHRRYSNENFDKFHLFDSANKIAADVGRKPPLAQKLLDELREAIIEDHVDEFESHLEKVTSNLSEFLDHAVAVYKIKRERYTVTTSIHPVANVSADN